VTDRNAAALLVSARRAFPLLPRVDARGFLVGGAVRDLILGRVPRDADIAIAGASGEAARFAKECGGRVIALGSAPFDVVRVAAQGVVYDFAEIVGASIEEDLSRRDFTIGAIALPLDAARGIVDPFGGARDLERSLLRMVKESNFVDDPLRVMRGARLLAELGLSIDDATLDAMRRHAGGVAGSASERIGVEWLALLEASDEEALRRGLELLRELGLDRLLVGGTLSDAAIRVAAAVTGSDAAGRLAAIALEGDEAATNDTSLRLGLGGSRVDAVRRVCRVVRHLLDARQPGVDPVVLYDEGEEAARRAVAILRAKGHDGAAGDVEALIARDGDRIFKARPLLDGHAIGALLGIAPGPNVGTIRRALLEAQLRGEVEGEEAARAFVGRRGSC
jgi:tRNA nucleotidyltransferase/poly(A) polymerase